MTYAEVWDESELWARAYAALGVGAGDTVAVMTPISSTTVCSWLGLARLGAVEVPVNTAYKGTLLSHVLVDSGARVLVVASKSLSDVLDVVGELPDLQTVVTQDDDDVDDVVHREEVGSLRLIDQESFLADGTGTGLLDRAPEARDIACVLYTSGTTGPPKGALVTWGQLYATATGLPVFDELTSADSYYSPYPGFHIGGKHPPYVMALAGGRVVLKERFRTQDFWDDVERHGCTVTFLLSAMSQFLLERAPDDAERRSPLTRVMAVPMPPNPQAVERRFGVRLSTIFNMTEISVPIRSVPGRAHHSASCGYLREGYQARIVDPEDREVPDGTTGELLLRTDQPWVHARGYWNAPDKTVESWRNLWFHTGDAFRRDPDGSFYFVDRLKDVIRRRGENISSFDVESACLELPDIQACAVVGVASEYGEEDVLLVAVPTDPDTVNVVRVVDELRSRLPAFMVPAYVDLVTELPLTPTQKIRKAELRRRGITDTTYRTTATPRLP